MLATQKCLPQVPDLVLHLLSPNGLSAPTTTKTAIPVEDPRALPLPTPNGQSAHTVKKTNPHAEDPLVHLHQGPDAIMREVARQEEGKKTDPRNLAVASGGKRSLDKMKMTGERIAAWRGGIENKSVRDRDLLRETLGGEMI